MLESFSGVWIAARRVLGCGKETGNVRALFNTTGERVALHAKKHALHLLAQPQKIKLPHKPPPLRASDLSIKLNTGRYRKQHPQSSDALDAFSRRRPRQLHKSSRKSLTISETRVINAFV
jgi:hypothetical protein